jgi:WhiB family transcriptional regulator, redox-sensing transcriptional regulator
MEWRLEALCRGLAPEHWFPAGEEGNKVTKRDYDQARLICDRCPVEKACLDEAISREDLFGMWGGKTPRERAAMMRRPHLSKN